MHHGSHGATPRRRVPLVAVRRPLFRSIQGEGLSGPVLVAGARGGSQGPARLRCIMPRTETCLVVVLCPRVVVHEPQL